MEANKLLFVRFVILFEFSSTLFVFLILLYFSADIEMFSRYSPYAMDILHLPDGILPASPASNPLLEFSSLLDWGDEGRYPLGSIVTEELARFAVSPVPSTGVRVGKIIS